MDKQGASPIINAPVPEEEVDLVQLGVAIFRRWKLVIGVFVIVVGLGTAFAFGKKPTYRYWASVQLAALTNENGQVVHWLKPESAKAMLQEGLIDQAISQYAKANKHFVNPARIKITVQTARGGNVVTLSGKGGGKQQDAYLAIERRAAELLAQQTSGRVDAYRAGILASLEQAKLDLAALQDPKMMAAAKSQLQQALLNNEAELANLKQQHGVFVQKKAALEQSLALYEALVKDLKDYLTMARKESLNTSRVSGSSPTQAMTALLLNNQVQQNQTQLMKIQNQLTVRLPQQISETIAGLANNEAQQTTQQTAVDQARLKFDNYTVQHRRDVAAKKADISSLKAKLNQVQPTQLIAPPMRSLKPEGRGRLFVIVLSAVLGIMLGMFTAIMWNFGAAIRERIQDEQPSVSPANAE